DARGSFATVTDAVLNVTWGVFVIDYIVNLVLAKPRWRWFYRHLLDLAIVALPLLRPLRLLRLVTLLRALQQIAGSALRGRVVVYVAGAASLLIFVAALAELDQERHAPGASITTFASGLWWAVVTITTVGYGDLYPVTDVGRLIAVAVMLGGIALIGVVTATLASWIVERVAMKDESEQAATRRQVAELADEVRALRFSLNSGATGGATPTHPQGTTPHR
ncbi:MAG: ion transporter, partial [Microbacteriaceae bacterium]|nr:ion transporter [Microbacteriaceae bacterium]